MVAPHHPAQNQLLAALSRVDFGPLHAALEWVPMRVDDLIHEPGVPLQHAYFPTTAIVSLRCETASGASVETASIGHEGMVGMALFLGADTSTDAAVVLVGGHGYRLGRQAVAQASRCPGVLPQLVLRYSQTLLAQMMQSALCIRHHSVEQQLCRWLLISLNRLPGATGITTRELTAHFAGEGWQSVAAAADRLQQAGYIRYTRWGQGPISVLDRAGLAHAACECYDVLKNGYAAQPPMLEPTRLH